MEQQLGGFSYHFWSKSVPKSDDVVLLCCDGAAWYKSKTVEVPEKQ